MLPVKVNVWLPISQSPKSRRAGLTLTEAAVIAVSVGVGTACVTPDEFDEPDELPADDEPVLFVEELLEPVVLVVLGVEEVLALLLVVLVVWELVVLWATLLVL